MKIYDVKQWVNVIIEGLDTAYFFIKNLSIENEKKFPLEG